MQGSERLREAVRAAIHRERERPGLVVAVSGGPDSVALLRAIHEVRPSGALPCLLVAHLNHQLRGAASDEDAAFVADLAERLGLRFIGASRDVRGLVEATGQNLEATARTVRYRWLAEVAREHGLDRIATGHTADDQAETVLMRLFRGTGIQGLRGIAGERELEPGVAVVRPLRTVTRTEVLTYLETIGQPARHDASNDDLTLRRNRIRQHLLPLLATEYNPAIARVLVRLADQAEEIFAEEEASAAELLRLAERPRAGGMIVLDRRPLADVPRFRLRGLFRAIYRREGWPQDDMPFARWDQLAGVVLGEETAVDLAGGVRVEAREQVVQVTRRTDLAGVDVTSLPAP